MLLDCSKGTVRKHLEHIHRKLGVQTRTCCCDGCSGKVGVTQRVVCYDFFIILYADLRIVLKVYFEENDWYKVSLDEVDQYVFT
jgi:hypothetical protein